MLVGNTYAQKGKQAIGFGLSYGTEIESVGLGLKYQYNITNPIPYKTIRIGYQGKLAFICCSNSGNGIWVGGLRIPDIQS